MLPLTIALPLLFSNLTTPLPAADWPQFLGPNRDGVTNEREWSARGATDPLWRLNVGAGYSCPSIVDGRLVTLGYDGDASLDLVWCLDAETGEELWVHEYESTGAPRYHGGGTLTTPAIADGVVYTLNRHGVALALELETGDVRWRRDYREELELPPTFHGYCASPVVLGERVLYVLGGTAVMARRDGGELVWRTEDHGDAAYSNPTVFELDGRELAAVMLGQVLYVLDLDSGEEVHEFAWPLTGNAVHVAQPLVLGDRLLVSTAYGKGSAMLRLGDAREPEVLWTSRRLRNKVTGVYLHGEHLYGFDESMLKCFDLDGNERWRVRGLGMGALSIAGDRLLILSSGGELVVAEANPEEYRELSRSDVLSGGAYWTMPVLVDGRIYVRNSLGDLACLDHRAGEAASSAPAELAAAPAPSAADLLAAHAERVGADFIRRAHGLELVGEWAIPGRGQAPTPATWTFQAPNRWRIGVEGRVHTFDGEFGWELLNGKPRLYEGPEAEEAPLVGRLIDVFAPVAGEGARTLEQPVSFMGRPAWVVEGSLPAESSAREAGATDTALEKAVEKAGDEPPTVRYYFDVETHQLVGRDGDSISTMAFHGEQPIGDARVPARITTYRVGNGQEETFHVNGGSWTLEPPAPFERGEALSRLLRTPEEKARDEELLRERFESLLGRYRTTDDPRNPEEFVVALADGDLVVRAFGTQAPLRLREGEEESFDLLGVGATLLFHRADDGAVTGADLMFGPEKLYHERVDD